MFKRSITVAALFAASVSHAGPVFRTIARSSDAAPGLVGVTFDYLSDPRIGAGGTVQFWADLTGPGIDPAVAGSIWSTRSGPLSLLYREGAPSGQGPTSVWAAFPWPCMSADGLVAFTGSLADTAAPTAPINLGLFSEDAARQLQKLAREGEAVPPPGTGVWASLPQAQRSGSGLTTFFASGSIWSVTPGATPLALASNNTSAPGGLTFDSLGPPSQDDTGTIAFRGTLRDGTVGSQPVTQGLWMTTPTGLQVLVRAESPAPGTGAGFDDFPNAPALDTAAVFWTRLYGLGTGLGNDEAIFSGTPGALALRVHEGDQAAGCPAGATYFGLGRRPALAHNGGLAFAAQLSGVQAGTGSGVWAVAPSGVTTLLARAGDQAPRLPIGTLYDGFEEPYVSESGRVVVLAHLRGPGISGTNDRALLVTDPTGRVYPVLRTGDASPTGPTLIDEIVFDNGPSGRSQMDESAPRLELAIKLVLRDPAQPLSNAFSQAILTVSLGCLADIDNDGQVTVNDFLRFLIAFNTNNLRACDFSGNGLLDVGDFIAFLNAVNTPCP